MSPAQKIIDEADPEGLLVMGAPADEYESFCAEVARRLLHGESPADFFESWLAWHGRRQKGWCIQQLQQVQRDLGI